MPERAKLIAPGRVFLTTAGCSLLYRRLIKINPLLEWNAKALCFLETRMIKHASIDQRAYESSAHEEKTCMVLIIILRTSYNNKKQHANQ
jgi:hypothetical protein